MGWTTLLATLEYHTSSHQLHVCRSPLGGWAKQQSVHRVHTFDSHNFHLSARLLLLDLRTTISKGLDSLLTALAHCIMCELVCFNVKT